MSQSEREQIKELYSDCSEEDLEYLGFNNDDIVSIKPSGVESIQNEREDDYGDAKTSHSNIAKLWNAYLERKNYRAGRDDLDATDVAVMLSLMKVSRLAYKRKHDSFLDFASYADFALKFQEGN